MDTHLPEFYTLEDALLRVDADFSASEVHGIACAVLAFNNQYSEKTWQLQILKGDGHDFHIQEARELLQQLFKASLWQLNSGDLSFELFLPPEQESLEAQVLALQKWCQGFAFGLALSGLKTMQDLPEDTRDWVQDVIKIGAAGELDVHNENESEEAFMELTEFVRMGVLMMNEELQPIQGKPQLIETFSEQEE